MWRNKIKKILALIILCILTIVTILFWQKIQTFSVQIMDRTKNLFFKSENRLKNQNEQQADEEASQIQITTAISLPYSEKITTSGVTLRDSIRFLTENFREISFIIPKNVVEVKKGEILIKFDTKDIELRAEKIKAELELKRGILARGEQLDHHSVISKDELDKIRIEVASASGELKELEHKVATSTKVAPFDCFIKHHGFISGSFVSNGQEVLTIFKKDTVVVETNINLNDLSGLKEQQLLGKTAKLTFSDGRKCSGQVIYFSNNADQYTASLLAIIELKDSDGSIRAGEVCEVAIYTGELKMFFLVPEEAICGDEEAYHVFIIKKGLAYKTDIQKHGKKGDNVRISGISDGDIVAVSGAHRLTNLCKVQIM